MGEVIPFDKAAHRLRVARRIAELEAEMSALEQQAAKALALMDRWRLPCTCGHNLFRVYWFEGRPVFRCDQCHTQPEQSRKLMVITPAPGGGQ